jgi:hypothetical protein
MESRRTAYGEIAMYELLWFIGLIAFWLLLQLVILPKLGYPT